MQERKIVRGHVYFLRGKITGRIKIGKSTNIEQRFGNLRNANADDLELLGVFQTDNHSAAESCLHSLFSSYRLPNGEWFTASEDIVKAAKFLNGMDLQSDLPSDRLRQMEIDPLPVSNIHELHDRIVAAKGESVFSAIEPRYVPYKVGVNEGYHATEEDGYTLSYDAWGTSEFVPLSMFDRIASSFSEKCHGSHMVGQFGGGSGIKTTAAMLSAAPSSVDRLAVLMAAFDRSSNRSLSLDYGWDRDVASCFLAHFTMANEYLKKQKWFYGFGWHHACRNVLPVYMYPLIREQRVGASGVADVIVEVIDQLSKENVLVRCAPFCDLNSE